jgi:hypothetical protein
MAGVNRDDLVPEPDTLGSHLHPTVKPDEVTEVSSTEVFKVFRQMHNKTDCVTIGQRIKDMDLSCPTNASPKAVYTKAFRLYTKVVKAKKNKHTAPGFMETLPWRWESQAGSSKVHPRCCVTCKGCCKILYPSPNVTPAPRTATFRDNVRLRWNIAHF